MNHTTAGPETPLADLLAKPFFVVDPVFPKSGYLAAYAHVAFRQILTNSNLTELIGQIQVSSSTDQMVMLMARSQGFWAIDLDIASPRGVTGREEFVGRVRDPIRRPPPEVATIVAEQHILARGVSKIQIEGKPVANGGAMICPVKTIGWYYANILFPRDAPPAAKPAAGNGARPKAAPDFAKLRREARLRVFRGEAPGVVIGFLHDAQVSDAEAFVARLRAEREACIRSRARADLVACTIMLLALVGMYVWIRPMGMPPVLAFLFLFGALILKLALKGSLALLKAGHVPGDFSGLMPPDPELDPRMSWIERAVTVGFSPLMGYGIIFLAVAIVIALGARVMNF